MKKNKKKAKRQRIIKGILFFIVPIIIYFLLEGMHLLGDTTRPLFIFGIFISTVIGMIFIIASQDDLENATISIAGHVIDNEDLKNLKNMSLWQKIKVLHIIDVLLLIIFFFSFFASAILIVKDPFNIIAGFSNPGRIKIILILTLVFVVDGVYIYRRKELYSRWRRILFWIITILTFIYFINMTSPR